MCITRPNVKIECTSDVSCSLWVTWASVGRQTGRQRVCEWCHTLPPPLSFSSISCSTAPLLIQQQFLEFACSVWASNSASLGSTGMPTLNTTVKNIELQHILDLIKRFIHKLVWNDMSAIVLSSCCFQDAWIMFISTRRSQGELDFWGRGQGGGTE